MEVSKDSICNEMVSIVVAIGISMGSFACGYILGFSSPAVPNINANPNPFHITTQQQSWYNSMLFCGCLAGSFVVGFIMDTLGRKCGLMIGATILTIGWVVTVSSWNFGLFITAKFILGFGIPIITGNVAIYDAEIASSNMRGVLVSIQEIFLNFGIFTCYLLSSFVSWQWLAVGGIIILNIWMFILVIIPESPRWLLLRQRVEEAQLVLNTLRRSDESASKELQEIQESIRSSVSVTPWKYLFKPPLAKSLFISATLFSFQALSAFYVLRNYAENIFESTGSALSSDIQATLEGLFLIIGAALGSYVAEKFERATLLTTSGSLMAIGYGTLGIFFKIKEKNPDLINHYLTWLPQLSIALNTIGFSIGFGLITFVIGAELFPSQARGRANTINFIIQGIFGVISMKAFANLKEVINYYGTFLVYGAICMIAAIFSYFFVPQTKGKSLEELQQRS